MYGWNLICWRESGRGDIKYVTRNIVHFGGDSNSWSHSDWIALLEESDYSCSGVSNWGDGLAAIWWLCCRIQAYCQKQIPGGSRRASGWTSIWIPNNLGVASPKREGTRLWLIAATEFCNLAKNINACSSKPGLIPLQNLDWPCRLRDTSRHHRHFLLPYIAQPPNASTQTHVKPTLMMQWWQPQKKRHPKNRWLEGKQKITCWLEKLHCTLYLIPISSNMQYVIHILLCCQMGDKKGILQGC